MKVEYFPRKNWHISKRNVELFEDREKPCHWKVSKCQALGWLRTLYTGLARNIKFKFKAAWKHLRIVNNGRTFSYKYFLDLEEKYGKYRTAGSLIILRPYPAAKRLITSLQERQRHWWFTFQILFAALHSQQPQPPFRAQAPLHEQETSTDPWSYLTRMANINKNKLMYKWKRGGSTFSPSSECSHGFSCSSLATTDP